MEKTAKQLRDESAVIKIASKTIRDLAQQNEELSAKLAEFERRDRAVKIAHALHQKGVDTDVSVSELSERLSKVASAELDVIEKAASFHMADATGRFAQLGEGASSAGARSALDNFILS